MPNNKGQGGNKRRKGKKGTQPFTRHLLVREIGQAYALVTHLLGDGRLRIQCFQAVGDPPPKDPSQPHPKIPHLPCIATIRGKMKKRVWINVGDYILVGLRDFQTESTRVDVIHKYNSDEARSLVKMGQVPQPSVDEHGAAGGSGNDGNGDGFHFEDTAEQEIQDLLEAAEEIDLDDL